MRAAGVQRFTADVEVMDLPDPPPPGPDEVLIEVHASGVANWDDLVRTGSWDLGRPAPLALGTQCAGVVAAVGSTVDRLAVGGRVMTHSVPLRDQGTWAPWFLAAAADVAPMPTEVSFEVGGVAPIPLLTADQTLRDALDVGSGTLLLVHGAGGVTGTVLVQLATYLGARVYATAGARSAARVRSAGAVAVLDYHDAGWADLLRNTTGGVSAAVNAVAGADGAAQAITAVTDGGILATITSGTASQRGVEVKQVYVAPDGPRLATLGALLASGVVRFEVAPPFPLSLAGVALAQVPEAAGRALVLLPLESHSSQG
jgi:NADPH:quinone reductase-like Zn-dependent oxidoreductase